MRWSKPRRQGQRLEVSEVPQSTTVTCGFCKGKGRDPFGLMSHLSNCQVCGGRGGVWIREPFKECSFCQGSGRQPHSGNQITCGACGGKGVVAAIEASVACPTCGGSGTSMAPLPNYCLTCKGQGVVPAGESG